MAKSCRKNGFSLTEVLLAVGTLTVGMVFIAGVFPVAIHFTTIATERTIAAVAADEAFAKISFWGVDVVDLDDDELRDFNDALLPRVDINPVDFAYPSDTAVTAKQYYWSALCRLTEARTAVNPNPPVQVIVFVSRKTGTHLKYPDPDEPKNNSVWVDWPMPVEVEVSSGGQANELEIDNFDSWPRAPINDGCRIVDDATGNIYRVLERYPHQDDRILLDRDWEGGDNVWVVPPPINGGRNPCIAIYQKVIRF
jgi:hypothetical protein